MVFMMEHFYFFVLVELVDIFLPAKKQNASKHKKVSRGSFLSTKIQTKGILAKNLGSFVASGTMLNYIIIKIFIMVLIESLLRSC